MTAENLPDEVRNKPLSDLIILRKFPAYWGAILSA